MAAAVVSRGRKKIESAEERWAAMVAVVASQDVGLGFPACLGDELHVIVRNTG
jgi:hypothetical protein